MEEWQTYEAIFIFETDAAILIVPLDSCDSNMNYRDDDKIWLPKSQISFDTNTDYSQGDLIDVEIPDWLAENKGLI